MDYVERLAKIVEGKPEEHLHYQIALMAMEDGNELVAIYSLFRGYMAADIPWQMVNEDLLRVFLKNLQNYDSIKSDPKIEFRKKFCIQFVRLVGILLKFTSLEMFDEVWPSMVACTEEFLTSKSTTQIDVLQVISIIIFIVHFHNRLNGEVRLRFLLLYKYALLITFEIMGRLLQICASVSDVFSTSLLPGLLVFIEWFVYSRDIITDEVESDSYPSDLKIVDVEERLARARWLFWGWCKRFVNKLFAGNNMPGNNGSNLDRSTLWEDSELQGFIPLAPVYRTLKLSSPNFFRGNDRKRENRIRIRRIADAARKAVWVHEALELEEDDDSRTTQSGMDEQQRNITGGETGNFRDKHVVHIQGKLFSTV